jgi:hypothetical protein
MRQHEFDEPEFVARLRQGEEHAYRSLVQRFQSSMIGLAASIIGSRAQAEEVVQGTWLAVFASVDRFERRCNLATWVFSIMRSIARGPARVGRDAWSVFRQCWKERRSKRLNSSQGLVGEKFRCCERSGPGADRR